MPGISLAHQAGGPNPNVSALVFARWISLCYITLAQLRVVFPGGEGAPAQAGLERQWLHWRCACGWSEGCLGTSWSLVFLGARAELTI